MNTVDAAKHLKTLIANGLADIDFAPPRAPKPQSVLTISEEECVIDTVTRDHSTSWTVVIEYVDAEGHRTERRITVLRFEHRVGGLPAIAALCHECGEHRLFRIDRIHQMLDITTGEILNAHDHLQILREQGLPSINRGMASFCRILAFIARCDGAFHSREFDTLENALASYALRFDGSTEDIDATLAAVKNLTPDTIDLSNAFIALLRSPREIRSSVATLLLRFIGAVIDADGIHAPEEVHWAVVLKRCLEVIRA